jgi:hypothetical protein
LGADLWCPHWRRRSCSDCREPHTTGKQFVSGHTDSFGCGSPMDMPCVDPRPVAAPHVEQSLQRQRVTSKRPGYSKVVSKPSRFKAPKPSLIGTPLRQPPYCVTLQLGRLDPASFSPDIQSGMEKRE